MGGRPPYEPHEGVDLAAELVSHLALVGWVDHLIELGPGAIADRPLNEIHMESEAHGRPAADSLDGVISGRPPNHEARARDGPPVDGLEHSPVDARALAQVV